MEWALFSQHPVFVVSSIGPLEYSHSHSRSKSRPGRKMLWTKISKTNSGRNDRLIWKKHRSFSTNERRKSWPASFRGGWHFDWEVFFRYSASIQLMGFRKGTELLKRVWRRHSLRRWCQLVQTTSSSSSSSWPSNDDNDDVGQGFNKDQIKPDTGSIGNKSKQMLRPRICSQRGLLPTTTKAWDSLKPKDFSIWHPALAREKKNLTV